MTTEKNILHAIKKYNKKPTTDNYNKTLNLLVGYEVLVPIRQLKADKKAEGGYYADPYLPKDEEGNEIFICFTSEEQAKDEQLKSVPFRKLPFLLCCRFVCLRPEPKALVLNFFSEYFTVPKEVALLIMQACPDG